MKKTIIPLMDEKRHQEEDFLIISGKTGNVGMVSMAAGTSIPCYFQANILCQKQPCIMIKK